MPYKSFLPLILLLLPQIASSQTLDPLGLKPWQRQHLEQTILEQSYKSWGFFGRGVIEIDAHYQIEEGEAVERAPINQTSYARLSEDKPDTTQLRDFSLTYFAGAVHFEELLQPFSLPFDGVIVRQGNIYEVSFANLAKKYSDFKPEKEWLRNKFPGQQLYRNGGGRINLATAPVNPMDELSAQLRRQNGSELPLGIRYDISEQALIQFHRDDDFNRSHMQIKGNPVVGKLADAPERLGTTVVEAIDNFKESGQWDSILREALEKTSGGFDRPVVMLQNGKIITPENQLNIVVARQWALQLEREYAYPECNFEVIPAAELEPFMELPKDAVIQLSKILDSLATSKHLDLDPKRVQSFIRNTGQPMF